MNYESTTDYQLLSKYSNENDIPKNAVIVENDRINYTRSRAIDIDFDEIDRIAETDKPLDRILIVQFFENTSIPVLFDEPIWHTPSSYTQTGKVLGEATSEVNLTVYDQTVSVFLKSEQGEYLIQHNGTYHEAFELNGSHVPVTVSIDEDAPGVDEIMGKYQISDAQDLDFDRATDTNVSGIDILVIYSSAAKTSAGGEDNIRSLIYSSFIQTNQSFENTYIDLSINPVHVEETSYEPTSYSEGLYCITETGDDCLEYVHDLREEYYADLVVYVINNNAYCGLAWHIKEFNDYSSQNGFSLVNWRCLGNNQYALAREIGKNLGAQTDHESAGYEKGVFPYSYGYQTSDQTYRSIMAMDCPNQSCTRINYWSAPFLIVNGNPLGETDYADNHRSLNETGPIVSEFRTPPSPPDPPEQLTPLNQSEHSDSPSVYGWTPSATATQYQMTVRYLDTNELIFDETVSSGEICTETLCVYSPGLNLEGNDYIWHVAGINSLGTGSFGDGSTFYLQFDAPVLELPANSSTLYTTRPTFQWQEIDAATAYNFQLYDSSGTPIAATVLQADEICQDGTCTADVDSDIPIGSYQWRVSGLKTITGHWSGYNTFAIEKLYWSYEFGYGAGWEDPDTPRKVADVNGDGINDIVGFSNYGVHVALGTGTEFESSSPWSENYGSYGGWSGTKHIRTLADVNGDGMADIIGFGNNGVIVSLSNGLRFDPPSYWTYGYGYNQGWDISNHPRMITDVNGDGMADIVGFGDIGVLVALSDGSQFSTASYWTYGYGFIRGWDGTHNPRMISDVNGDGCGDVVGFGHSGVLISLSLACEATPSNSFGLASHWINQYGQYTGGWDGTKHIRTVGDVNGDGMDDIVGFGDVGVIVSLSDGSQFGPASYWTYGYCYLRGWYINQHPRMVVDVDGDGMDDVVGFGDVGILVSLSEN